MKVNTKYAFSLRKDSVTTLATAGVLVDVVPAAGAGGASASFCACRAR